MEIAEPQSVGDTLVRHAVAPDWSRFVADPSGSAFNVGELRANAIFVIGPEGGLSPRELQSAQANRCQIISLGRRVLRVETAALYLAAIAGQHMQSRPA